MPPLQRRKEEEGMAEMREEATTSIEYSTRKTPNAHAKQAQILTHSFNQQNDRIFLCIRLNDRTS